MLPIDYLKIIFLMSKNQMVSIVIFLVKHNSKIKSFKRDLKL